MMMGRDRRLCPRAVDAESLGDPAEMAGEMKE